MQPIFYEMKKIVLIIGLLLAFTHFSAYAQRGSDVELRAGDVDSTTHFIWVSPSFAYQWPFGSLKETFKSNMNFGVDLTYKTNKNWTVSLDFNYLFGSKLRDQAAVVGSTLIRSHGIGRY